jgi:hypothetical protein
MTETILKEKRSYSLPKLVNRGFTESKLFHTEEELMKTKKILMERFESK